MSELKTHTQCCYPLSLGKLLPKTCDFYWKQKWMQKRQHRLPLLWAPSSPHQCPIASLLTWLRCPSNPSLSALRQLDSHIPISSPRFCQQERIKKKKKKKAAVVEGLLFGAQGWNAQHITASRQHSSSSTCALILLTWSSYFFSFFFFFLSPLEGYYFCRPLMCSQRKGLCNTKRENQSCKKVTLLHVRKLIWSS